MTADQSTVGFAAGPDATPQVAGSAGCCGNPVQSTTIVTLPHPADTVAAPCCGTTAAAEAANACCAPAAKADAVASAKGCCG